MFSKRLTQASLAAILLMLPPSLLAQTARRPIQVGVPAISMGNIIIFFAKEAGIYEKHGLDAEPVVAKHRLAAPYPNLKGMKTSYKYIAVTRPEVWKHTPEEFIDASFVEELDKSGFIKKLYAK